MDPTPLLALALASLLGLWLWRQFGELEDPPTPRVRISGSDPYLEAARARSRDSHATFHDLLATHRDRAQVKLRRDDGAEYAGQWADVLAFDADGVHIRERGPGVEHQVAWADVEDWQVELPDGTVRGAFTVMACWRIRERETGKLPIEARRELLRFMDA